MHQKIILCDHWVSIGSSNIDRWNLRWNLEANQEIDNEAFSGKAAAVLDRDFAKSARIDLAQWRKRSFFRRWLEWFWGVIDIWLDRITGHRN
jgi:phosphatidylserine/phosphatidylglycerophosphate/cardiolipin synthase-like enzyme